MPPINGMTAAVCAALGISRATVERRRSRLTAPPAIAHARPRPPRALTKPQRQAVLNLLHAPRFADQAPAEIYATLLDEGVYHCSIRTMYRLLGQSGEIRERRQQLRHPAYQKPELLAEKPNEVWSWDITKLMGPAKWSYYYLYVILRGRLVCGRCRECHLVQAAVRRCDHQTQRNARSAHPARRSGQPDESQGHRISAG